MRTVLLFLLCGFVSQAALSAEACTSENPSIGRIQAQWQQAAAATGTPLQDSFGPRTMSLLPLAEAEARFGPLNIKSRKAMRFFSEYQWSVETEGDYWLVADSGAWLDVRDDGSALEPLTFNHGLRCAGIHKALKFHLHRGRYTLLVASDAVDKVRLAADQER